MTDATALAPARAGTRPVAMTLAADAARAAGDLAPRPWPCRGRSPTTVADAAARRGVPATCAPAWRADAAADRGAAGDVGLRRAASSTPLTPALAAARLRAVSAARPQPAPARTRRAGPLKPGDAVGVALLTGDFELGATGTVTHVDGDRVYAFGHPLYNLGPTAVPDDARRRARRAAEPDVVEQARQLRRGRSAPCQQDRATAIAGRLGRRPDADSGERHAQLGPRAEPRTFKFSVVTDSRSRRC